MRRPAPAVAAVATGALAVVVVSLVTIGVRAGRSTSHGPAHTQLPAAVSVAYYTALQDHDPAAAFRLLCPAQQQQGEAAFARTLALDDATGTGVTSFMLTGPTLITNGVASVAASVGLASGATLPLHVLLDHSTAGWQVCSSDLGGVLPAPGSSATSGT